jgi:hypothetical protein
MSGMARKTHGRTNSRHAGLGSEPTLPGPVHGIHFALGGRRLCAWRPWNQVPGDLPETALKGAAE